MRKYGPSKEKKNKKKWRMEIICKKDQIEDLLHKD